jgi:metal-dependent amidase/aminoacylase/carboxypeptidase family protein
MVQVRRREVSPLEDTKELQDRMKNIMQELKDSVDLSIEIRKKNGSCKKIVDSYWEDFFTHFLNYIKKREEESGEEILKRFSIIKFLKFF